MDDLTRERYGMTDTAKKRITRLEDALRASRAVLRRVANGDGCDPGVLVAADVAFDEAGRALGRGR